MDTYYGQVNRFTIAVDDSAWQSFSPWNSGSKARPADKNNWNDGVSRSYSRPNAIKYTTMPTESITGGTIQPMLPPDRNNPVLLTQTNIPTSEDRSFVDLIHNPFVMYGVIALAGYGLYRVVRK